MKHGFLKVAAVTPEIRVANCEHNANSAIEVITKAAKQDAQVISLPELCITGYTCGDLFFQSALRKGALDGVYKVASATKNIDAVIFIGAPFEYNGELYNCAFCLNKGEIVGIVPKTHLPNYAEFYELRHFTSKFGGVQSINLNGKLTPFGTDILFHCDKNENIKIAAEICEDLWAPIPPCSYHALAGATVIVNLSASDEVVGKAQYRRNLVANQSARLLCGYVYSDAGRGESTSDMVFAAHNLVCENGKILSESAPFENSVAISEIDVEMLVSERLKNITFKADDTENYTHVPVSLSEKHTKLTRKFSKTPFVPQNLVAVKNRCEDIINIQAEGLAARIKHINVNTVVVGISGGLDSCLALLVAVESFKRINKPLSQITAVTMPCFGTTSRTFNNAKALCGTLGVGFKSIDITNTVKSNFNDIGQDESVHDVTFENTQARVRTLVLMNLANKENGIVLGTGDLSELALGWATYNGDHMSMYNVNCGVPKTLVRHIVEHISNICDNDKLGATLKDILNTPVSPELLPAKNGDISQETEEIVGPYILHDFFLYYVVRMNFSPQKIYYIARFAFCNVYEDSVILKWLRVFYKRFFAQQFKRNCVPDGPKVGSVALSPRGDWRMPSDADGRLWLDELENL